MRQAHTSSLQHFAIQMPPVSKSSSHFASPFSLIGDLHQPLHAGNGTDKGGNDVKVTFFGEQTNLHSVWDSGIIDRQNLSFSEYAGRLTRRINPQDVVAWWQADPVVWIGESTKLRESILQPEVRMPGRDEFLVCHRCKAELLLQVSRRAEHHRRR